MATVCDPSSHRCVGCVTNADCTNMQRPHCDTNNHACAECLSDADCPNGGRCTLGTCRLSIRDGGNQG
jgi:Cys-rich repeat protein